MISEPATNIGTISLYLLTAMACIAGISPALAFKFDTGTDITLRWDNTVKYSAAWRAESASARLIADANTDDGDRNFDRGLIGSRVDLLSELDVTYRAIGARVSGAGWYDAVYHQTSDNNSPGTANPFSVPHDEFTDATRRLHGGKAEILDAFVFSNAPLGAVPASLKAGRHTLLWGESLLLATNGISYAQAPLDFIKAISVPGSQAKELFMPVGQVSGQLRPTTALSLAAYYQFEWRETRIPAVGSYFSSVDILDEGGERLFTGAPGEALFRGRDDEGHDTGQWGLSTRYRMEAIDTDFGLYYIRFHEKLPQLYLLPEAGADPAIGKVGEYSLVYPEDIQLIGTSFATTVAEVSLAGEAHMRFDTPLASTPQSVLPAIVDTAADNRNHPLYAVGNTVHAQVSAIYVLPPWMLWDSASWLGEVGWQHLAHISENPDAFDPGRRRDAWGFQTVFTPTYYQVLPDLDINLPLTLSYTPQGKSPLAVFNGPHEGGTMSVGVSGMYRKVWNASVQFTHFYGSDEFQTLKDRDFIAFSIQRTF